jgi:hypothetical protein
VNRRGFLRIAALGPAMLTLAGVPVPPGAARAREPGVRALDGDDADLMLAIAERIVETGEPNAPGVRELAVLDSIEGMLAQLSDGIVGQLRTALWLVDWWPTLGEWRFARFRSLTVEERDESLESWRTSGWALRRQVFYALRNLSLLGYWSREETWPLIGYRGRWLDRTEADGAANAGDPRRRRS